MLIICAYVDFERIGQIQVRRQESRSKRRKIYTYKIVRPRGFEDHNIKHRYDDGWMILTEKVLKIMRRHKK